MSKPIEPSSGKSVVLIVDDVQVFRDLYARALEAHGCEVITAADGMKALEIVARVTPDLILLDCMMPVISGPELLAELRTHPALVDVPVIFLTAAGDSDELVSRAFELGASDYIAKPINARILAVRVRALLDERRDRKEKLASKGVASERDRLLEQVLTAQSLQRAQLPGVPAIWRNWWITGALEPCEQVGGDLFDIILDSGPNPTIALIDVSGHGLAAAMVASSVRGILRVLVTTTPFDEIVPRLNQQLAAGADGHYACVALVRVTESKIHIVNAGLPPVVLLADGKILMSIEGSGPPPGMIDHATYETTSYDAVSGLRVVLASDGLTEPFGAADHVAVFLDALGLLRPEAGPEPLSPAIGARIRALFASRGQKQGDDAAVVVLDCRTV